MVYLILAVFILLFIIGLILPQTFAIIISSSMLFLNTAFMLQGWALILAIIFSLLGMIKLLEFMASFYPKRLTFHSYKEDTFKNIHWKWKWQDIRIENLWCYCPTCHQELAYKSDHLLFKTEFFCQKCEKHLCSYEGDNINYVLSNVKAEIRRISRRKLYNDNKKDIFI